MNSIRCSNCALLNFETASVCKRCGLPFNADAEAAGGAQYYAPPAESYPPPAEGNSYFWDQPNHQPNYVPPPPPSSSSSGGKRLVGLVIILAVAALVGFVAVPRLLKPKVDFANLAWAEYKSPDGKFSITMPSAPKDRSVSRMTPIGNVQGHLLESDVSRDGGCMMAYADYPVEHLDVSEEKMYDYAVQGALAQQRELSLGSRKFITLDGYRGLEVELKPSSANVMATATGRIFWVPPRMYVVMAGGLDTPEFKAMQTRCLDSFHILGSGR
ncbi:MAG TPA: hypothetical protein VGC87_09075 [Pyrinomonadaceae bacterium]|jgi:hypothetical protein